MSEKVLRLKIDASGAKSGGQAVKTVLKDIHQQTTGVIKQFENLENKIKKQEDAFNRLSKISTPFDKIEASINTLNTNLEKLVGSGVRVKETFENASKGAEQSSESFTKNKTALSAVEKAIVSLEKQMEKLNASQDENVKALKEQAAQAKVKEQLTQRQAKAEAMLQAAQDGTLKKTLEMEGAAKQAKDAIIQKDESLKKLHKSSVATKADLQDMQQGFQNTAKAVVLALGPLSGVAARITAFSSLVRANTGSIALFVGGITALTVAMSKVISLGSALERQMLVFNATIQSTNRQSEATAHSLNALAESFESVTLASLEGARSAVGIMMTFENISVDMFEGILFAAQGLSEVFGGALEQNARLLARALDEPARNLDSLRRIGVQFTDEQRDMIRIMEAAGMKAEAQAIIWERVGVFQDVAKESAQGLAGAMDSLGSEIQKTYESISTNIATSSILADTINELAKAVKNLRDNQELLYPLLNGIDVVMKMFAKTTVVLANNIDLVTMAVGVLASAIALKGAVSLTIFTTSLLATAAGAKTAAESIRGLTKTLGAVPFILGAAVGAGILLYQTFSDSADRSNKYRNALAELNGTSQRSTEIQQLLGRQVSLVGDELEANLSRIVELRTQQIGIMQESANAELKLLETTITDIGVAIENAFDRGRYAEETLAEMTESASAFASVLDDIQKATKEGLVLNDSQLIEFQRRLEEIAKVFPAAMSSIDISRIMESLKGVNEIKKSLEEATDAVKTFESTVAQTGVAATGNFKSISDAFKDIMPDANAASQELIRIQQAAVASANAADIAEKQFAGLRRVYQSLKKDTTELDIRQQELENTLKNLGTAYEELRTAQARLRARSLSDDFRTFQLTVAGATEELEAHNRAMNIRDISEDLRSQLRANGDGILNQIEIAKAMANNLEGDLPEAVQAAISGLNGFDIKLHGTGVATALLDALVSALAGSYVDLKDAAEGVTKTSRSSSKATTDWAKELDNLRKSLDPVYAAEQERARQLEIIAKGTKDVALQERLRAQITQRAYRDIRSSLDPMYNAQQQYADLVNRIIREIPNHVQRQRLLKMAYDQLNESLNAGNKSLEDRIKQLQEERKMLDMSGRELYIYQTVTQEVNRLLAEGHDLRDETIRQLYEEANATYSAVQAKSDYEEAQRKLEDVSRSIADSMMNGFEAAMEGGESFRKWFGNLLRSLALQAIRNQIVIPIVGQMMGVSGNMGSMLPTGATGIQNALQMGQTGINFFAGGGSTVASINSATANMGYGMGFEGMGPPAPFINPNGMVAQGIGAIGPALSAYGFGQKFGVAGGVLGGIGTTAIAGGIGGALAGTGFMAGATGALAGLGPIGWAAIGLGALAGGMGLFGSSDKTYRTRASIGTSATDRGAKWLVPNAKDGEEIQGQSAFGFTNINVNKYGDVKQYQDFLNSLMDIDNAIAMVFTDSIDDVKKALDGWSRGGERGDQANIAGSFLDERMKIIYTTIDEALYEYALQIASSFGIDDAGSFAGVFTGLELLNRVGIDTFAEDFVDALTPLIREGENAGQTMTNLAQSLAVVNPTLEMLGHQMYEISLSGADMSRSLLDLFGSMEAFTEATASYYQNFYSEQERFEHFTKQLTQVFDELGYTLPQTREGFRGIIESLDLTTESGRQTYATLMQMNGAVSQYISGMEAMREATLSVAEILLGLQNNVTSAYNEVRKAVDEQKRRLTDIFNDQASVFRDRINQLQGELREINNLERGLRELQQVVNLLRSTLNSMRLSGVEAQANRRASAQQFIRGAVSSGTIPSAEELQPHLRAIQEPSENLFATFEDYARDFLTTQNDIETLLENAESQLSVEEQTLGIMRQTLEGQIAYNQNMLQALEDQYKLDMAALDAQLRTATDLYNAAMGIDDTLKGGFDRLTAAMSGLVEAINALKAFEKQQNTIPSNITRPTEGDNWTEIGQIDMSDPITKAYAAVLGRTPDIDGYNYWQNLLNQGLIREQDLFDLIRGGIRGSDIGRVPAFANGGVHSGGWRMVGERGPELEYTPPSRIFSNTDSASLVDNSELIEEIKALREEVGNLRHEARATAINTSKTHRILDDVTQGGTTLRTVEVEEETV